GERRRIFQLQPARYVNEVREARRMALGEAIFAEALDLVEAALRESRIVTALDHPPDHLALQLLDVPLGAEGRHRLSQLVGLFRAELRRIERDLHRLLLEDRHAQRPPENPLELVR